jgi:hypothetical protein
MKMIDREQAKVVAGFGSTTRANTRLLALLRAGLLKRIFAGTIAGGRKAVYSLSRQGAALVGAAGPTFPKSQAEEFVADPFFEHRQRINAVYLAVKFGKTPGVFRRWIGFRKSLSTSVRLIPDGYFEIGVGETIHPMFVEVDRGTEPLSRWKAKTTAYLQLALNGEFERLFGHSRFRVLVLAPSSRRLNTIRATVSAITEKIFWFSAFESIDRQGLWSAVWLRPRGEQSLPLLEHPPCAIATNATT